jgi:hypothetical protein
VVQDLNIIGQSGRRYLEGWEAVALFVVSTCRLPRSLIQIQPSVLNLAVYRLPSFYSKIINHLPCLESRPERRKATDETDDPLSASLDDRRLLRPFLCLVSSVQVTQLGPHWPVGVSGF